MAETKVVRIRRQGGVVIQTCDVYIGRRLTMGGWSLPQSIWANPYTIKQYGSAEKVCELYEAYIRDRLNKEPELREQLKLLRGKVLGCFCEKPPCHGYVLIKLINEYT